MTQERCRGASLLAELACILDPEGEKVISNVRSAKALCLQRDGPNPVEYEQPTYNTSKGHPPFGRFYAPQSVSKKVPSLAANGKLVEMDLDFSDDNDLKPLQEYVHDKAKCVSGEALWAGCTDSSSASPSEVRLARPARKWRPRRHAHWPQLSEFHETLRATESEAAKEAGSEVSGGIRIREEHLRGGERETGRGECDGPLFAACGGWRLHNRAIEVSALIHDELLLRREDADAISIDEFAAEVRDSAG